jgi:hypothetical protein
MAKGKMTKGKMGKGEMANIGGEMAKGELGKGEMGINRKAVPCDIVCEGIFASAVSEEIRYRHFDFSTIVLKKGFF